METNATIVRIVKMLCGTIVIALFVGAGCEYIVRKYPRSSDTMTKTECAEYMANAGKAIP